MCFNNFPHTTHLQQTLSKTTIEIIESKEEKAQYEPFLILLQCFQLFELN